MVEFEQISVNGLNALQELERLRADFKRTGLYPILLGNDDDAQRVREWTTLIDDNSDPVRESAAIDPACWFTEKSSSEDGMYAAEVGEWPTAAQGEMELATHCDILTHKPFPSVHIALLPLKFAWEAFAALRWGGWNECPLTAEHCAIHRYWEAMYGAQVVSITSDVAQCVVDRPPTDRDAALHLAREQYLYCSDIVDQGTGTISTLAASLLNSKCWYFWWD